MSINDPPPSYELATGIAVQATPITQPTTRVIVTIPEQQQQHQQRNETNGQRCFPLVNTSEMKKMRYSKACLAVVIFFCFCGALAILVYFFADD